MTGGGGNGRLVALAVLAGAGTITIGLGWVAKAAAPLDAFGSDARAWGTALLVIGGALFAIEYVLSVSRDWRQWRRQQPRPDRRGFPLDVPSHASDDPSGDRTTSQRRP